jgi:hypothetical protein
MKRLPKLRLRLAGNMSGAQRLSVEKTMPKLRSSLLTGGIAILAGVLHAQQISVAPPIISSNITSLTQASKSATTQWAALNQTLENDAKSTDRSAGFCQAFVERYANLWRSYLAKQDADAALTKARIETVDANIAEVQKGGLLGQSNMDFSNQRKDAEDTVKQFNGQKSDLTKQLEAADTTPEAKKELEKALDMLNRSIRLTQGRLEVINGIGDDASIAQRTKAAALTYLSIQKQYYQEYLKSLPIYQYSYATYYGRRWIEVRRDCITGETDDLPKLCPPGKPDCPASQVK